MNELERDELWRCARELLAELELPMREARSIQSQQQPEPVFSERRIVIESSEPADFDTEKLLRRERIEQRRFDGGFEIY